MVRWLWPATLDREVLGVVLSCRSVALCPWAWHCTCMYTLSTQELMGTWLDCGCWCVWIVSSAVMAAGAVCSPGSWVGIGINRSHNIHIIVKATTFIHWMPVVLMPPLPQIQNDLWRHCVWSPKRYRFWLPGCGCFHTPQNADVPAVPSPWFCTHNNWVTRYRLESCWLQ